ATLGWAFKGLELYVCVIVSEATLSGASSPYPIKQLSTRVLRALYLRSTSPSKSPPILAPRWR
ncbi:hypothetical protein BDN70DRAFT_877219, partial [Pholiota conissans]